MKIKKNITIVCAIVLTVLAGIVFSFADGFNVSDIFKENRTVAKETYLYQSVQGELQKTVKIKKGELFTIIPNSKLENNLIQIKYDDKKYYIDSSDLMKPEDFEEYCFNNGLVWVRAEGGHDLYTDAELTENLMFTEYNADAKDIDEMFIETNKIVFLQNNTPAYVIDIDEKNNSAKVIISSGDSGYVEMEDLEFFISDDQEFEIDYSKSSNIRGQIVKTALNYEGKPYVWGGTSLETGTDCSGFTMLICNKFGASFWHSAQGQYNDCKHITKQELQPGDLVFYKGASTDNSIGHVALYIGNDQVIHALNHKVGVVITSYNYETPMGYGSFLD